MEEMIPCAPEHQAVFRRVWARVMGEGADCPSQTDPPDGMEGDLSCRQLERMAAGQGAGGGAGGAEDPRTARLCGQIRGALESWRCYRTLARRAGGGAGAALAALAAGQYRQGRRLAAAYFLLTGVRYWPDRIGPVPVAPSLWGALRQLYQREMREAGEFLACAEEVRDAELAQLYQELAADCQGRCRRLRALLEK